MLFCQNKPEISVEQLTALVNSDSTFLVDVRTPEEYAEAHIDRSVNIPLNALEDNLLLFENKKNIVVFCRSGGRSAKAKEILQKHGFANIANGMGWENVKSLIAPPKDVEKDFEN